MLIYDSRQHVYRLEGIWSKWCSYFERPLPYTRARPIDQLGLHLKKPPLAPGQSYCGLWFLQALDDAVRFAAIEPDTSRSLAEKEANALARLFGAEAASYASSRILTRIDIGAFAGQNWLRDEPLLGSYKSSNFVLRAFEDDGIDDLVWDVSVPDRHIEVFYGGYWHKKSPDLGIYLKDQIRKSISLIGFRASLH